MVIHENTWFWGHTWTIVLADGKAMCRVSIDNGENHAWLDCLIVHESIRKQDYGTRLLKCAEQQAKKLECDSIWLFIDGPEWLKSWYEQNGYVFQHYNEDGLAVMMKKIC